MTDIKQPMLLPLLPTELPHLIEALERMISDSVGRADMAEARVQMGWLHERAMKLLAGLPVGMPRGSGTATDIALNALIEVRANAFRSMLAETPTGPRGQQLQTRVACLEAGMRQMWADLVELGALVVSNTRP